MGEADRIGQTQGKTGHLEAKRRPPDHPQVELEDKNIKRRSSEAIKASRQIDDRKNRPQRKTTRLVRKTNERKRKRRSQEDSCWRQKQGT